MARRRRRTRRRTRTGTDWLLFVLRALVRALWFLVRLPYWAVRAAVRLARRTRASAGRRKVRRRREEMHAQYEPFTVLETLQGRYEEWERLVMESESAIGIILGARGSGKSALGIKCLENLHARTGRTCCAMGFRERDVPAWVRAVHAIEEIPNGAFVLIDEGGVLFSSRKSMSDPNTLLSELVLIARHRDISILFISQNSANIDVNVIRQADYLLLKPSSLLQIDFERKKITRIYEEVAEEFARYRDRKGVVYVYSTPFCGFATNPLPSFWTTRLSKAFRGGTRDVSNPEPQAS